MSAQRIEGSTDKINDVLRRLFQAHGVEAIAQSGCVTFPAHAALWANGELFRTYERIVQLDVRLGGFDGNRVLIESVSGIGLDLNAQASSALDAFAKSPFHVFLPAFFGRPPCHGTDREIWTFRDGPRVVFRGPVTSRFGLPPAKSNDMPDLDFFPAFMKRLEKIALPRGIHWVRIYQARHGDRVLGNEVLLDNRAWDEMQHFMAEYPWPFAEKPYDVRVFFIVKDEES
jgi:hypothetical protein